MPAAFFKCPDGGEVEIAKCLEHGSCRMGERCLSTRLLAAIGFDREWRGVTPSAAGNSARYLLLKKVSPYTVDPQDRAWAILGTGVHKKLDRAAGYNVLSEERLDHEGMTGVPDDLEQDEENPGKFILWDDKVFGSFKVRKVLGIVRVEKQLLDDQGNPILFKSGKNKGEPKTKVEWVRDLNAVDIRGEAMQLNRYRIMWESKGFPISKMFLEVTVRDGGLQATIANGINRNIYKIPIPRMDDGVVMGHYMNLSLEVDKALVLGYAPICSPDNRWFRKGKNVRCHDYCEVKAACIAMGGWENETDRPTVEPGIQREAA